MPMAKGTRHDLIPFPRSRMMLQTRSTSKRIESGPLHDGNEVLPQDDTVELPSGDSASPPAKKRRRGHADPPKKLRRGNPAELCQLNLDVLFIIATYIHPLDLLNLARTCKSLRRLLMDRSSAFVWRAVRRQFKGLPDCPDDLSEPAYTNLVFYARCHGCGKYSSAILWYIRRRYCPDCRVDRLCSYSYWPQTISRIIGTTAEAVTIHKEYASWHDKDQVDSLMQEYERSSDKEQFLSDKKKKHYAIYEHAKKCENWQRQMASDRKDELNACRRERDGSILERLKQLGYEREVSYFGSDRFRESRKKPFKPLTDKEWARMLPTWLKTMNHHRRLRLDAVVHQPRGRLLSSEYDIYVRQRSPDTPIFDLLPHMADVARFPPFRDIITAPEGTEMGEKPFASAFAQLPVLVKEWRKQLDVGLAELVRIPPHLSSQDPLSRPVVASNSVTNAEACETDLDKLHLACALFDSGGHRLFTYPEIFLISTPRQNYPSRDEDDSKFTGSIRDRFGIRFLEEAPYIVHACGLDPSVATSDNMDHRNARLRCLTCRTPNTIIMNWRDAMLHARFNHRSSKLAPLSESSRWQLVSDEHIDTIKAVEESVKKESSPYFWRCLLCQPRIGDASSLDETVRHLRRCHEMGMADIGQGVHYVRLGMDNVYMTQVEMVEEGEQVIFRKLQYIDSWLLSA